MKKVVPLLLLVALVGLSGCSTVPAGHVGIKVYLLGKSKGVETEELGVGRYWIGVNEELYLFPTYKQNYVWTKDEREESPDDESFRFQTKNGLEVGADVGITYYLEKDKVHSIFQKYRRGIDEITDKFLRNHVRDAFNEVASKMPVEAVYGAGKTRLMDQVEARVRQEVAPEGIVVEKIYLVNSFRLPETVTNALNLKIEATQRAEQRENELREATAQAEKKIAQARGEAEAKVKIARAEARANQIVSRSLTPQLVQYEKVKKWDGVLPRFTGGGKPLISFTSSAK